MADWCFGTTLLNCPLALLKSVLLAAGVWSSKAESSSEMIEFDPFSISFSLLPNEERVKSELSCIFGIITFWLFGWDSFDWFLFIRMFYLSFCLFLPNSPGESCSILILLGTSDILTYLRTLFLWEFIFFMSIILLTYSLDLASEYEFLGFRIGLYSWERGESASSLVIRRCTLFLNCLFRMFLFMASYSAGDWSSKMPSRIETSLKPTNLSFLLLWPSNGIWSIFERLDSRLCELLPRC